MRLTTACSISVGKTSFWQDIRQMRYRVQIVFRMPIPSKKNKLMPRGGAKGTGHNLMYKPGIKAAIDALHTEAAVQWGTREPVLHPDLQFWFFGTETQDVDGMQTTLMDAFKKAKVIVDDSIKFCNGLKITHPANLDRQELGFPADAVGVVWVEFAQ